MVVKKYEKTIKCKKKGILNLACKQGLLFEKFKKSDKFKEMLSEIRVSKSTMYFKVILIKVSKTQKIFVVVKFYEKLYEIH